MKKVIQTQNDSVIEVQHVQLSDFVGVVRSPGNKKFYLCKQTYFCNDIGEDITDYYLRDLKGAVSGESSYGTISNDRLPYFLNSAYYQGYVFDTAQELFEWMLDDET